MPAVDLRELVKNPIVLTGKLTARAKPHPLHEAIPRDRRFTSPGASPLNLPAGHKALANLEAAIHASVPGVDKSLALEAHVRLLTEGLPVVLADSDVDGVRQRSAMLTGVFRDSGEEFDGTAMTKPRFGAVGTLSVLLRADDPTQVMEAALVIEWVHMTSAMLRALVSTPGLALESTKRSRRLELVLAGDVFTSAPDLSTSLRAIALLLGASPNIHTVTEATRGAVATEIKRNNPAELIVLGDEGANELVGEFTSRNGHGNLHMPYGRSPADVLQWAYENLPRIMGVGPGLMPQPEVLAAPGRPRLPVVGVPRRCAHHGTNTYVQDGATGTWWTRDFAQHGDCQFKSYDEVNNVLKWRGDHDGSGALILDKHKGPEGITVKLSEASACHHPASHLA